MSTVSSQNAARKAEFNLRSSSRNLVGWVFQISLASLFVYAGGLKIFGDTKMIQLFEQVGAGQWFRYVTGLVELVGALLLLSRSTATLGALMIICTMVGAIVTHVFDIGGNPVLPILFLIAATVVMILRWNETAWLARHEAQST